MLIHCCICAQVNEADVLERLEKMCDPETDAGDWITHIDIVEKGSQLELKDTGMVSCTKGSCRQIWHANQIIFSTLFCSPGCSHAFAGLLMQMGKCKSECRTIAKSCDTISEDLDLTDLSAMVVKGKKRADIKQWMCYDSTDACLRKPPPVPSVSSSCPCL